MCNIGPDLIHSETLVEPRRHGSTTYSFLQLEPDVKRSGLTSFTQVNYFFLFIKLGLVWSGLVWSGLVWSGLV